MDFYRYTKCPHNYNINRDQQLIAQSAGQHSALSTQHTAFPQKENVVVQ